MKADSNNSAGSIIFHWHNFRLQLMFEGVVIGTITGFIVVLFRFIIEKSLNFILGFYQNISINYRLLPWFILLLMAVGYFEGFIVKKEPMISGSGIPQVEGVLLRKLDMNWWRVILGKLFGGILSIGAGLSLGREGPSVQIGAAVGQGFSRIFKRAKVEEKFLITSGASAGLAAAFNAPLAGAMFALEEVHKNFSPLILLSSLSAALSSDFVSSKFFGLKPVFRFENISVLPLDYYFYIVILGVIIGITGAAFNEVLLKTQKLYAKQKWLPVEFRPVIPMLLSVAVGILLPQVLGGGNNLIMSLTNSNFTVKMLLVLLFAKFFFTMACYGSGMPGGIFLPLLAVGALIGTIYGSLSVHLFHLSSTYTVNFLILSMAGYFTAVVRAPITGIILITEMTGSFSHLLSVSTISIVAYFVADVLGSKPVYESLLERFLKNNRIGSICEEKGKAILEYAVCMGSCIDGHKVKDVKWPLHCLIVGIRRGHDEIIPKGGTTIYPGDYLTVLADEDTAPEINDKLSEMVQSEE